MRIIIPRKVRKHSHWTRTPHKSYLCDCGAEFSSWKQLIQHQIYEHDRTVMEKEGKKELSFPL